MCLILLAVNAVPGRRLVVAANRDEFYSRETDGLHRWDDKPIIAGRDRLAGGTWMGVSTTRPGRFAAVTNYRDGEPVVDPTKRSRGDLPVNFLVGAMSPEEAARELVANADLYAPVNLIVADETGVWWATNWPQPQAAPVGDGLHGVSNGAFNSPWPKVVDTSRALGEVLAADGEYPEDYLAVLANRTRPTADRLPDTGVGSDREADLSPAFIRLDGYGTRASTIVRIGADGHGDILERRFAPTGEPGNGMTDVVVTGESAEAW